MRNNKGERGFTLVETLVAVAILVILMGFAFVALIQHQRDLKQLELDETAKELYIAAQNHLTMAKSQDLLAGKELNGDVKEGDVCYYFVDGRTNRELVASNLEFRKSVLYEMLPYGSIDETVRTGGSYVIKYNLKDAVVQEVFYTDLNRPAKQTSFSTGEKDKLFSEYSGVEKKQARKNYDGDVIGWYDGSGLTSQPPAELKAPTIEIRNAETLTAIIKFKGSDLTANDIDGTSMRVFVEGKTSGIPVKNWDMPLDTWRVSTAISRDTISSGSDNVYTFTITLDSITDKDKHFSQMFEDLIPGENISIYVEVYNNRVLSTIARSAKKTTNSLFASVIKDDTKESGSTVKVARISNFRHLENMDKNISNFYSDVLKDKDADGAIEYFEQSADLVWKSGSFDKATGRPEQAKEKGFIENVIYGRKTENYTSDPVYIYDKDGNRLTTDTASNANTFVPVSPTPVSSGVTGFKEYDGSGLKVSNVTVSNEGVAGLFGSVQGGAITSLELTDCTVTTSSGNAGALVGTATDTDISKVLVRNTLDDDSALEVAGTDFVGGLVGSMTGGSVELSAAAVYVKSTGTDGAAGGLVGCTTGNAYIENSYSSGHTKDGKYQSAKTGKARYNVQAESAIAGGLVGKAEGTGRTGSNPKDAVSNCYSTCSAYGTTVGGLVGSMSAGSASNCYVTGLVEGKDATAKVGTFIGNLTGTGNLVSGNTHYSLVNMYDEETGEDREVPAIGNDKDNTNVKALDESAKTFNDNAPATSKAWPYDDYVTNHSGGKLKKADSKYPFKNIKQLSGDTSSDFPKLATTHYGDWPMPEVMFENSPNQ